MVGSGAQFRSELATTYVWGFAAGWPLGGHANHCAPKLAAAVSRERAQGKCWHNRTFWAAILLQDQGLACVRSTSAMPPVQILDLGGYVLW